jgi:serine/threonine protein kinase
MMYGGKLLSEGGYGCVYYPEINCLGKEERKSKYVTKIQRNDESAKNELNISSKVLEIENNNFLYSPVRNSCSINISELNSGIIENCEMLKENNENYLLMKIKYVGKYDFMDYMLNTQNKELMNTLIESYRYLLYSIQQLYKKGIIHYDLKENNIIFDDLYKLPIIIDFGMSIDLKNIKQKNSNLSFYFFKYAPDYYIWCPEIHFINYLIHKKNKLDNEDVKKICEKIVKNNKILSTIYSSDFLNKYKENMINYFDKYIKYNKKEIIERLIKYSYSWDKYSLSLIFLRIIYYLYPNGYDKNNFIIHFSQHLLYNIHPDPSKRYNNNETLDDFDNYLMEINMQKNKDFKDILKSLKRNKEQRLSIISKDKSEIIDIKK